MFFWHQSEAKAAATVWNWSGKTLSPGALLAVLSLAPTICPWVSEDECGFAAAFYWPLDVARKFGECVFVSCLFMTYRMESDGLSQ